MWRFACTGTIEGVRHALREATCVVSADQPSFDRVRACLLAELDAIPTNGVMVEVEFDRGSMKVLIEDVPLVLTEAKRPTKTLETLSAEASNPTLEFASAHLSVINGGAAVRPAPASPARPLDRQEGD